MVPTDLNGCQEFQLLAVLRRALRGLAPRANGHRFGLWIALPAVLMGLLAGTRNGIHRYCGFSDNGNPSIYPGYKEDQTPYFVKHNVSERHKSISPDYHVDQRDPLRLR